MDPSLFRIDWQVMAEVLTVIVVLSFFVERALSIFFENRLFLDHLEGKGLKELIALVVAFTVVRYWHFDAMSIIMHADKSSLLGYFVTGAIVSGGSKASIKLFHDVLDVKSSKLRARQTSAQNAVKP